jgi:hypothetical protein
MVVKTNRQVLRPGCRGTAFYDAPLATPERGIRSLLADRIQENEIMRNNEAKVKKMVDGRAFREAKFLVFF